jgi:hypothetical protein
MKLLLITSLMALTSLTIATTAHAGIGGDILSGVVSGVIQSAIRPQPRVIVVERTRTVVRHEHTVVHHEHHEKTGVATPKTDTVSTPTTNKNAPVQY